MTDPLARQIHGYQPRARFTHYSDLAVVDSDFLVMFAYRLSHNSENEVEKSSSIRLALSTGLGIL